MPIPAAVAAAGVQAGGNMLGNLFNVGSQAITNAKNRRWQEKMFNWQQDAHIFNWNMENEYNAPAAQMARLKAAGLNPALVYGGGANAQGGSISSPSAGSPSTSAPQVDASGMMEFVITFMKMQLQEKQMSLLEKQTLTEAENARLRGIDADAHAFDLSQRQKLAPGQLTALELDNIKRQKDIVKTDADTQYTLDENERKWALQASTLQQAIENILTHRKNRARTDAEINHINQQIENLKRDATIKDLDIELKRKGIQPGSPWYVQAAARLLGGQAPESVKKAFKEKYGIDLDKK